MTMLLLAGVAWGQQVSDFTFSHIGQAEGMRNQRVYSVVQTSDGALWWSTKNDVERYNGVSIRHYLPGTPDHWSDFAGKSIKLRRHPSPATALYAFDNKGHIYVFDKPHDRFRQVVDVGMEAAGLQTLNDILPVADGFWLATQKGIYFLRDGHLTAVRKGVHATQIVPTSESLLFCSRQGVLQYRGHLQSAPPRQPRLTTIVSYDVESGYYDDLYNKVWLGGYASGIHLLSYDADGALAERETVVADVDVSHNPIRCFTPYDANTMLIGIDGLGVYKVQRSPQPAGQYHASTLFNSNEGACGILHGNGIYTLLHDSWGNIVVGSYSGGIDIARPVGTTIAVYQHITGNQQSIVNDHVYCVAQRQDGRLLMGTDDGISIFDPQARQWSHCCRGTVVLDLCKSPDGTVLAATYGKGVLSLGSDGSARTLYSKSDGSLDDDHVYRLLFDRDGHLWIGCLDGRLVERTADGSHYYSVRYVEDMLQHPDGRIIVGTAYGIFVVSPQDKRVTELRYTPEGEKDVNRYVHTLYLDKEQLWIGTDGGGIYVYNLATKHCRHLTTRDGLPSNFVNSIIKDSQGRILIATEQGLAFAARHLPQPTGRESAPGTGQQPMAFTGVNYCYGVDREFTSRSVATLTDGNIILGSTTGAIVVNPKHIQNINYTTTLNITGISCGADTDSADVERLHQMLADRKIRLAYRQRTFDLYYESIHLRNQSDIVYQYRLDEGAWSTATTQQYLRLDNVEPGNHRLTLRSVSRTCGEVLAEEELTVSVAEPWWNSWWMWMVYLCMLAAAFYGAWQIYELHAKYMRLVVSSAGMTVGSPSAGPLFRPSVPETEQESGTPADKASEEGSAFIDQATKLVVDNISDSDFTIDRLCREMAMSRTLFYVKLKSYTGKSPQDFIRVIRLERAAALLRSGRSVTEAAALSGFDNPKYFSTVFKKYFGVSPSKCQ